MQPLHGRARDVNLWSLFREWVDRGGGTRTVSRLGPDEEGVRIAQVRMCIDSRGYDYTSPPIASTARGPKKTSMGRKDGTLVPGL